MNDLPPHQWSTLPPERIPAATRRSVLPILAPMVVVGLFWLAGLHEVAVIVAVVAAVITIATVASPTARDRFDRAAAWIAHHTGRVLTVVLLGIVQLVIFTPVAALAKIFRSDPMDPLAGRTVESRWLVRGPGKSLHKRQFGDENYRRTAGGAIAPAGSPRWIRGLVGGLALLLLTDVALGSIFVRLDRQEATTLDGPVFGFDPAAQEALSTQDQSRELMAQLEGAGLGATDPFIGWRFADGVTVESDLVNIVDGTRRTRVTTLPGEPTEIWFFGGSTMYGSGQSDLATIPSVVVELMDAAGVAIRATNFGHPAYSQWQQVQLLEAELSAGTRPSPDLVVFYDGFNDLTLQTQFGVHDEPTHLFFGVAAPSPPEPATVLETVRSWWGDHSATALAVERVRDAFGDDATIQVADIEAAPIDTIDPVAAADAAVAIHRRGVDHVVALGEGYGFETRFFWQPYLYTKDPLTPAEAELVDLPGYDTEVWLPMTDQVRSTLTAPVIDLSDALDEQPTSLFWDFVHTNERGAALVAEAMFEDLLAAISR